MLQFFYNQRKNKKGFTLIELIVVIAILAILALIAIPRMTGFQDDAKRKATLAEAKTLASTVSVIAAQNFTFTTTDGADTTAKVYSNSEVIGYAGISSGGTLTITSTSGAFTYAKIFGNDVYTITYDQAADSFNTPAKTTPSPLPTKTVSDTTFE